MLRIIILLTALSLFNVHQINSVFSTLKPIYNLSSKKCQDMQDYNTIVNFKLEEELNFKDFSLKFVKHRTVPGPNNAKWTMKFWDFEVFGDAGVKQLHWSSGTGRIAPLSFTYNTMEFLLILKILKTNKPDTPFTFIELDKDQLVIQKMNK